MKIFFACSALLLACSAFAADAPNLTGRWTVHNSIAGNESDQDCTFTQTDNKLAGKCKSEDREVQITGSVDGKKVTWKFETEYEGSSLTLTYTATIDDPKKISGSVDVEPYGVTGEFTATLAKEAEK